MKIQTTKDDIVFVPENEWDVYHLGAIFGWPDNNSKRPFAFTFLNEKLKSINIRKEHLLRWFIQDGNIKQIRQGGQNGKTKNKNAS